MILTYRECLARYGTDYMLKKEIQAGRLYRKENGLYTDEKHCSELALITAKYPRAVFSGESAYYYHRLTDVIPEYYHLSTLRTDSRIKDTSVRQYFVNANLFELGKTSMDYHGTPIPIYSRERLLVDLIRQKGRLPYDYYKELVGSFRQLAEEMDFFLVEECARPLRNCDSILRAIELEVL